MARDDLFVRGLSDRVAFYLCDLLSCAFYYVDRFTPDRPVLEYEVEVVPLKTHTTIRFVGRGREGYDRVVREGYEERLFPVNLFDRPHRIDPKPSRTVSMERYERWLGLLSRYKLSAIEGEEEQVALQEELTALLVKYPEGRTLRQLLEEVTSRPHPDADDKTVYKLRG